MSASSFLAFFSWQIHKNHEFNPPLRVFIELDSSITRLLGINIEKDILYGTDRQLSYHAKESHGNFAVINRHHWFKASEQPVFLTATQLPDILVGQTPKGVYQWIGINGISWGGKRLLNLGICYHSNISLFRFQNFSPHIYFEIDFKIQSCELRTAIV